MTMAASEMATRRRINAGASGYSFKEWKGTFYPPDLKADAMLAFYAERLGTVEINNTFYRMPKSDVVARWRELAAQPAFSFVWKASRRISHQARLRPQAQGALFTSSGTG